MQNDKWSHSMGDLTVWEVSLLDGNMILPVTSYPNILSITWKTTVKVHWIICGPELILKNPVFVCIWMQPIRTCNLPVRERIICAVISSANMKIKSGGTHSFCTSNDTVLHCMSLVDFVNATSCLHSLLSHNPGKLLVANCFFWLSSEG